MTRSGSRRGSQWSRWRDCLQSWEWASQFFLGVGVSMASVTNLFGRGVEINNSSVSSFSSTNGFVLLNFQRKSLDQNLFMPLLNLCHQLGLLRLISLLASFISSSRSRRSCRIIIFLCTSSCILAISDMMSPIYLRSWSVK